MSNFYEKLEEYLSEVDYSNLRLCAKAFLDVRSVLQDYDGLSVTKQLSQYELKLYDALVEIVKKSAANHPKLLEYYNLVLKGTVGKKVITETTKRAIREALTFNK